MLLSALLAVAVVAVVFIAVSSLIEGAEGMASDQLRAVGLERSKAAVKIRDDAKAANRPLTADEDAKIDALLADVEAAADLAAKVQAREDREARLAAASASLAAPQPRKTQRAPVDAGSLLPPDTAVTSGMRQRSESDPQRGFRAYDEFVRGVKDACTIGHAVDERLRPLAAAAGNSGLAGETGAFLTPPAWSSEVYERAITSIPILADCDRITLTGPNNTVSVASYVDHDRSSATYRHSGIAVYRVQEGDDITVSSLKVARREVRIHDVAALSVVTGDLLNDTVGFAQRFTQKQAEAIAEFMTEDVMWGTGAGQPLGAWSASNSACQTCSKEDGQAAASYDTKNILNMMDLLVADSEAGAKWYYNRHARSKLRQLKYDIGTGGQLAMLFERGNPDRIDGLPAYGTDHCEAPGTLGDFLLGDMRRYALVVKGTVETAMSVHLYFLSNQNAYRSIVRYGGMPLWDQSRTPRRGTSGLKESPWVKLEARS